MGTKISMVSASKKFTVERMVSLVHLQFGILLRSLASNRGKLVWKMFYSRADHVRMDFAFVFLEFLYIYMCVYLSGSHHFM